MDRPEGDAPLGVGRTLAEARQAQGLALADVAQQLKFMPRQLDALENERFGSLPGPTIARGMVRTYAKFLKLDPEPLLAAMAGHAETQTRDATPQLAARFSQPVPFSDSGRRSTLLYLALSAGVLGIAGGMVYEWRHERAPEFIAPAAQAPAPAAPAQTASAAPVGLPPAAEPQAQAQEPPVSAPAAATPKGPAPKAPAQQAATQPAPQAVAAAPQAAPAPTSAAGEPKSIGAHRIVLRFDEEAWIEVTDGAGRLLASSLNPAGSERVLQGRPPFNLVIGNASNVRVRYNDREVDLQPHVKVEVARFTLK